MNPWKIEWKYYCVSAKPEIDDILDWLAYVQPVKMKEGFGK